MKSSGLRRDVLELLQRDARMSDGEIAARLDCTETEVSACIRQLEEERVILGYSAIVNPEEDSGEVRAIIEVQVQPERDTGFDRIARAIARFPEVQAVHLVSGRYDLRLEIVGRSLQEIASFVASRLSSQKGVKSTATLFLLKRYKEAGIEFDREEQDERLKIVP